TSNLKALMTHRATRPMNRSRRALKRAAVSALQSAFEMLEQRQMFSAPKVVASSFNYEHSTHAISFTFDQNVSASLSASDLTVQQVGGDAFIGSASIAYDGYDSATNTATWHYTQGKFADGNYRAVLSAEDASNSAGQLQADGIFDFFFLSADVNH